MHPTPQTVRFVTWTFILLFISLVSGLYFWSEKKYETMAGTTTNAPEASNTRASTGLASHWTFDREHISGTTITDRVGSNTGTSSGSPTPTIGKFGQALDFDASDDHINVASATSLDIDATEDFSLAGWFNRDLFAADHTIVGKRNGQADTDDGYIVYIDDTNDNLVFEVSDTGDTDEYSVASTATFTTVGWHHFVAVWDQDSATGTEVYIDGVASGTDTGTIANIGDLTEAVDFRIGSESDGGNRFDGKLDDIRFYSSALTASEAYQLYTSGNATVNAPVEDPLSQSLLGYWKIDEGTGTSTTADSSGNGNTLTMTNADAEDWQTGQIGPYALDFNGTDEYLTIASPSSVLDFAAGASFSLTGWFNRDLFVNDHTILSNVAAQGNDGYIVWIDGNDSLYFLAGDNADTDSYQIQSTATFAATGWHHFAVSWEDDRDADLYIDGALDASTKTGTFASVDDLTNALAFRIGAETDAGNPFDGKLDDVRVYGYPLSASDVLKLYQTTAPAQPVDTGLVGHWTFDGPDIQNLTAIDKSGKGNHGTITGTTKTIGKLGQGLSFDGTGDYISMGTSFDISSKPFSLSAWVRPTSYADYGTIFAKRDSWNASDMRFSWTLGIPTDFGIYFSSPATNLFFMQNDALPLGAWSFLAVVVEASSTHLYVDGILEETLGSFTLGTDASAEVRTGNVPVDGDIFSGSIDDLRAYNRALSANEILNLYTLGR
jgi:hypothetical protein